MQYEVRNITYERPVENEDGTVSQKAIVKVGIVGDLHDLSCYKPIEKTFPDTHTIAMIKADMQKEAADMVAKEYPNT